MTPSNSYPRPDEGGDLLPCPFCGGEAQIELDHGRNVIGVGCKKCVCNHTPSWGGDDAQYWAVQYWNTRESDKSPWQPIETAPKDGTMILAIEVHPNPSFRPRIYEGRFVNASHLSCLLSGQDNPRFHDRSANNWAKPTHWMPLPPIPAPQPRTNPNDQ